MQFRTVVVVLLAAILAAALLERHHRSGFASADDQSPTLISLTDARRGFKTKCIRQIKDGTPLVDPPAGVFESTQYDSSVGPLGAYLTPDPHDGKKHPAIVWITGGDCNSVGDVWSPRPATNDQSARQYREAGIVMMFPSLRGGNQNPGVEEKFLGEVDDVVAAADFLARRSYVDPARIFLGGHSTGGTLVLLVSECSDRFRAVFSFGPVATVNAYGFGAIELPFDIDDPGEVAVRSPGAWLRCIKSPTFVLEGAAKPSNADSLQYMSHDKLASPSVHFHLIPGVTHFSILAPANRLIAKKIVSDEGSTSTFDFSDEEISAIGRP